MIPKPSMVYGVYAVVDPGLSLVIFIPALPIAKILMFLSSKRPHEIPVKSFWLTFNDTI